MRKQEKSSVYYNSKLKSESRKKGFLEVLTHVIVWGIIAYFFLGMSTLRPMASAKSEFLSLLTIAAACYLNYFFLYRYLFKRRKKILYFALLFVLGAIVSIVELQIVLPDIKKCMYIMQDPEVEKQFVYHFFTLLFFRNLAFIAVSVLYKFYREAENAYWLEKEKRRVELDFLKSKIDNHFLFNTINMLYKDSLAKSERLPKLILQLSSLLHFYVDESQNEKVSLKDELKYIHTYIDFELLRQEKPINVSVDFINPAERELELPPMLFESLINNAFKYGRKDGTGYIKIVFDITEEGKLFFSCKNNKSSEAKVDPMRVHTRKGLKNTQERLDLLYKKRHTFIIDETDDYFSVEVNLSLQR